VLVLKGTAIHFSPSRADVGFDQLKGTAHSSPSGAVVGAGQLLKGTALTPVHQVLVLVLKGTAIHSSPSRADVGAGQLLKGTAHTPVHQVLLLVLASC